MIYFLSIRTQQAWNSNLEKGARYSEMSIGSESDERRRAEGSRRQFVTNKGWVFMYRNTETTLKMTFIDHICARSNARKFFDGLYNRTINTERVKKNWKRRRRGRRTTSRRRIAVLYLATDLIHCFFAMYVFKREFNIYLVTKYITSEKDYVQNDIWNTNHMVRQLGKLWRPNLALWVLRQLENQHN